MGKDDAIVVLCLPAQVVPGQPPVTEAVLKPGLRVAVLRGGKASDAVTFDGDVNGFVNALSLQAAPPGAHSAPGVRVKTNQVPRTVDVDGVPTKVMVDELTVFLVDG